MSTDISPAFKFVEWKRFVCNEVNEKTWTPDLQKSTQIPEQWPHQESIAKWVYVFRESGKGATWVGEYYVDGLIYPVDLTQCGGLERNARPRAATGVPGLSLPYLINGLRVTYFTYISRIQLSLSFVHELERRAPELLLHVDVAYTEPPNNYQNPHQLFYDITWFYRAVDPFTVALHLAAEYRDACDDLIGYTCQYEGQPPDQARRLRERNNLKAIADILVPILDDDPNDDKDLKTQFSATGERDMRFFREDYSKQVAAKSGERDRRAAQLCFWLYGQLLDFARRAHFAHEEDIPAYLNPISQSIYRLQESTPGKAFLARWIEDESHWIHTYVIPQKPVPENVFQVGRKSASALVTIWAELPVVLLGLYRRKNTPAETAAALLVLGWTAVTRFDVDAMVVTVIKPHGYAMNVYKDVFDARVRQVVLNTERLNLKNWTDWVQNAPDAKYVDILMKKFMIGVDIFNFYLSVECLLDAGFYPNNWNSSLALIGAVGSAIDLGLTFAALVLKESFKRTTAFLGGISAALDILTSGIALEDAAQQHDYSAMAGRMAIIAGGLFAIGGLCCGISAAESVTIVGIPVAAICAAAAGVATLGGWVLVTFGEESPLAIFVANCYWGCDYGTLGHTEKPWSVGEFRNWAGHAERQVTALYNVICGFAVEGWNVGWLRVYTGNVSASSRFHLTFETRTDVGVHRPECVVDIAAKKMIPSGGDPISSDPTFLMFGEEDGRHYFQILPRWPHGFEPPGWHTSDDITCTVLLDYAGDGSYCLPTSAPMPYTLITPRWGVNTRAASSTSY